MSRRRPRSDLFELVVQVYQQARFRCSNPACGQWIVLDDQYMVFVDEDGHDVAANLLALCPDCYGGRTPAAARAAWKSVQLATDSPYDHDSFMFLAFLDAIGVPLEVDTNRLVELRRVIVSGAVSATRLPDHAKWSLELTVGGTLQLEAWRQGRPVSAES